MQSPMLALRLLLLQAQPVIKAHKFVDISWRENKQIKYSSAVAPTIKN